MEIDQVSFSYMYAKLESNRGQPQASVAHVRSHEGNQSLGIRLLKGNNARRTLYDHWQGGDKIKQILLP